VTERKSQGGVATQEEMMDLLTRLEPLDPELEPYMEDGPLGRMLRHPLVYSLCHDPERSALANQQLRYKQRAVAEAVDNGDWEKYIWLHERAYRLEALLDIKGRLLPDASDTLEYKNADQLWELAGVVWIDSENIWQCQDEWRDLFDLRNVYSHHKFMSDEDQETMRLSPQKGGMNPTVTVYRGVCHEEALDGFSWTLAKDTAEWFARRAVWRSHDEESQPMVATGTISKKDVIALMTGRGELEIVALPEDVHGVTLWDVE